MGSDSPYHLKLIFIFLPLSVLDNFAHIRRLSPLYVGFYAFGIPNSESASKFSSDFCYCFCAHPPIVTSRNRFLPFGIPIDESASKISRTFILLKLTYLLP